MTCYRYMLTDANGKSKFYVADYIGNRPGTITLGLKLPAGLTCTQCVIQWTYTAGRLSSEVFFSCVFTLENISI